MSVKENFFSGLCLLDPSLENVTPALICPLVDIHVGEIAAWARSLEKCLQTKGNHI
jgi:hypothetical protein